MPGPKSAPNGVVRPHAEMNRKVAKRLAARQRDFVERNPQNGQVMHKPGSQNRKK